MGNVEELLEILAKSNEQHAAQNIMLVMKLVESTENQIVMIHKELQAVNAELKALKTIPETRTMKEKLLTVRKDLKEKLFTLQEKLKGMKEMLNQKAGQLVNGFKKQRVKSFANVTKVLGIKEMVNSFMKLCEKQYSSMENNIQKINRTEKCYRETLGHVKNAGRAIKGKAAKTEIVYPEKGVFEAMRKPSKSMKNLYGKGTAKGQRILERIDKLEKAIEKKPSIVEKLKVFKEKQEMQASSVVVNQKRKGQENGR